MFVFRSSSGPLDAAETPATPGPKTPPMTEQRTTTKVERRTDRTQRGIDTSLFQYSGVFLAAGPAPSRSRPYLCASDRAARSRRSRLGLDRLALGRIVETPDLVADAHQKHRLLGILQDVNDPVLLFFQINRLAIGDQVQIRLGLYDVAKPLPHFALQEPQDAADLLQ